MQHPCALSIAHALCNLSVSSSGSSIMQQKMMLDIKKRSENFQYPQADRASCNTCRYNISYILRTIFQYPQADRASCNFDMQNVFKLKNLFSLSSGGSIIF